MNPNDDGMRYIMLSAGEMGYMNSNEVEWGIFSK